MQKPLAYRMRPKNIDEVVGQEALLGPGKIIRRMVDAKMLSSMILYGPPGTGKTSIASAIAGSTQYAFRTLNAATDSKKDLQQVVDEAKMSGTVVLLLDEIHRLDKTKQDFLLPHLESGEIVLIGATTENPYLSINPAIRSRTQIFEVQPLDPSDIRTALERALADKQNGLGNFNAQVTEDAMTHLMHVTNGDLRAALNALELAVKSTQPNADGVVKIDLDIIQETTQQGSLVADKDGDAHYDVISALQKSIRGSDTDAALHYLGRLILAGDLPSIVRRLQVIAYEDIGLANPAVVERAVTAIHAAEKLGFPEARIPLANAVIELALSPKSNSAMTAIDAAMQDIQSGRTGDVPKHLKDAHYKGAKELGNGVAYLYPHNYQNDWVAQQYLPDSLQNKAYFNADGNSNVEQAYITQYQKLKAAQKAGLEK
ncbi:DNA-dependent ATPase [Weissella viridescens]|uniref:Replication-associated recombination protein A n=1 Tax=Weissella viridescens TaxID=1629 RepID=A0A0R2H1C9_WEIVI|nr:replication-associated recombination protein A [Weissella viridescens]KRN46674.1 recombination factor protein RarA [Weissella viridescens]GEA94525.1 recombinase RarA [Weissella viridescens]SOB42307.1 DNA-dependent ATPase [Weissella viridescens]